VAVGEAHAPGVVPDHGMVEPEPFEDRPHARYLPLDLKVAEGQVGEYDEGWPLAKGVVGDVHTIAGRYISAGSIAWLYYASAKGE
jgi:hypothetical protein